MLHHGMPLPGFDEIGFRTFSENDEDGILLNIFSLIGTTNRKIVDIGDTVGGSNTANLIVNHGWTGLLFEGGKDKAAATEKFYKTCPDTKKLSSKVLHEWVTRENIDNLITSNEFKREIDLLSIYIDGVDYYIWDAIKCISPRVVIYQYQCIYGGRRNPGQSHIPLISRVAWMAVLAFTAALHWQHSSS